MKKLLTFLLCFVLIVGTFGLVACGNPAPEQKTTQKTNETVTAKTSVQGVSAPKLGGTITRFGAGNNNEQVSVSKTISATVEPSTALNKLVDYRVFWAAGAERENEDVSDYVIVEQDSDGSVNATVTCFQGFGDDVIVIQVVTREGGYTAECNVTYVGLLTEMSVTSSTLNTVNTQERGDYYELYTNNTYTFTVDMDNDLHSVKNYDLSVTTGGIGEFWFCYGAMYRTVQYGNSVFPQYKEGWFAYANEDSIVAEQYNLNDIVDKFISATISGTELTVVVNSKELCNYYEEISATNRRFVYFGDEPIYGDAGAFQVGAPGEYSSNARTQNATNLPSAYFTVTVTDANTNISSTVKLWVVSSVNGVSLSVGNLEF